MTKPPLTHQNLAGSTSPARIWLLSLESTSLPSSWLRVTRCPDISCSNSSLAVSFHNDCCIAVFLQGFLALPRRQGDAGSAVGRCIRQRSRVHSRALLLIPADCSHERAALERKPALKHRLGHLASDCKCMCRYWSILAWHKREQEGNWRPVRAAEKR